MPLFSLSARTLYASLTIFLVIGATAACSSVLGTSGTWRYKMTVTIETPEGDKVGSAVREVSVSRGIQALSVPQSVASPEVKGEAVVIDLGTRGVVFALLSGGKRGVDYADAVVYEAFPVPGGRGALTPVGIEYYSGLKNTPPVELAQDNLPMFVRFRDLNDPKTVEALQEFESCPNKKGIPHSTRCLVKDRFAEAFGEGVKLKSVTLAITEEAVTSELVKWLTWLPEYRNRMFDGQRYNTANAQLPFANSLAAGAFKAGEYK